jgi:hypothetical protein
VASKSSIISMNTHPDVIHELVRDRQAQLRREAREQSFVNRLRRLRREAR